VPGSAGRTAVKAVFECVASSADTNTDDEYGTSEIDVSWSSRPYVVVDDGRRGDLVYSDNDNENLMRAKQSAGDSSHHAAARRLRLRNPSADAGRPCDVLR
jgi:hypothetical protein